jgi:hypothetical protein
MIVTIDDLALEAQRASRIVVDEHRRWGALVVGTFSVVARAGVRICDSWLRDRRRP